MGARTFVAASSQFIQSTTTPITGQPYSIVAWHKPAATPINQCLLSIGANGSGQQIKLGFDGAGSPFIEVFDGTNDRQQSAGSAFTNGTWGHFGLVQASATSTTPYRNGVAGTTVTGTVSTSGLSRVMIGGLYSFGGTSNFYGGDIAEVAIWNVGLDAAEMAALAAGFSPLLIRPASLVLYSPLGLGSPEPDLRNSRTMTLTAAPTIASSSPPTFRPGAWVPVKKIAVGGPASFSQAATDAITLSEALARALVLPRSATDAVALSESVTGPVGRPRAATDALTVTDSATDAVGHTASATDTVTIAETVTRTLTLPRGATDAVTLAEATTDPVGKPRAAADALTVTDSLSRSAALHPRAVTDAVTVTDSATSNGGGTPATGNFTLPTTGAG